jgi:uncharacterized tellurite resistance protein B-like protein
MHVEECGVVASRTSATFIPAAAIGRAVGCAVLRGCAGLGGGDFFASLRTISERAAAGSISSWKARRSGWHITCLDSRDRERHMPFAEGPLEQDRDVSTLTMREAVTSILVAAVAADGTLVEQEAERLNALLPSMRLFRQTSAAHLQRLTETALDIIGSTGPAVLLPACAEVIPESLRAPLFALAVELVIVDGEVSQTETQFVDSLKSALGIDDEIAANIIEVLLIKSGA